MSAYDASSGGLRDLQRRAAASIANPPKADSAINAALRARIAALEAELAELRAVVERITSVLNDGGFTTMAATIRAQAARAATGAQPDNAEEKR